MATRDAGRSDAALVAAMVDGDMDALGELYDRHADALYRVAYRRLGDRQLAEEVLQDTYLTLWDRAELFDPSAGSLLAWLSTIARNRAIDRLRALGRRPMPLPLSAVLPGEEGDDRDTDRALALGDLVGMGSAPSDPEAIVDLGVVRDEVRAALATLPATERRALELAYYGELTQAEIAERLQWPLGTVKTRTRRALFRLRAALAATLGPAIAPGPDAEPELQGTAVEVEVPGEVTSGPR
jgi:RNA polymerase sigma-70 factor (ECF subfamily)